MIILCVLIYLAVVAAYVWGNPKAKRVALLCGVVFSELAVCYCFTISFAFSLLFAVIGCVCIYFYSIQAKELAHSGKQKNKYIAAVLAAFLGGLGVHKFYLRKNTLGAIYLFFYWTAIPLVAGVVEAIVLLFMSQEKFEAQYKRSSPVTNENQRKAERIVKPVESGNADLESRLVDNNPIATPIGNAETHGCEENFTVTIFNKDGKKYIFPVVDGQICGFELHGQGINLSGTYEVG